LTGKPAGSFLAGKIPSGVARMASANLTSLGSSPSAQRTSSWWQRNERKVAPYLFISPFFIVFVTIFLGPIVVGLYVSFTSWNGIGAAKFVGLANYARLFQDQTVGLAATNTLWYVFGAVLVLCPSALGIASALNHPVVRFRTLFRVVYFLPVLTSIVVVALMFGLIYDKDIGLLNWVLSLAGIDPVYWLGKVWGKPTIITLIIWRWAGYLSLYFLAGLQAIPRDLYESAEVDGANSWQRFTNVTIPMLRPIIIFVAVTVLIGSSQIFEEPYILTGGGPQDTTLSIAMLLYRQGLAQLNFGYACAIGFALFAVAFCVSWAQIRVLGMFRED
jgi:multiple sugar transport system permease protein